MEVWHQAKFHYIGLLVNHHQPELAETFFNSVTCKILHRTHFHNDFIFVRPAVSTEYIENDEPAAKPTFRAYYPTRETLRQTLITIVENFQLQRAFAHLERDTRHVLAAVQDRLALDQVKLRANFQIQVLTSLFFRNKGAYLVGKIINGFTEVPFALPILHNHQGSLTIDAALFGEEDLQVLFSFARAYFMVDMDVPQRLCAVPAQPHAAQAARRDLQRPGPGQAGQERCSTATSCTTSSHSSDQFRIAPGIKGMVMLVFDLPSFPYVFKLIKDFYPPQKDITREQVKAKYHARQAARPGGAHGRHARIQRSGLSAPPLRRRTDSPRSRSSPSQLEIGDRDGDGQTGHHQAPLHRAAHDPAQHLHPRGLTPAGESLAAVRVIEYGNALKDLVAANIFRATCCGRTSALPATARSCSTTTTRSNTSPTATSAACPRLATRKRK